MPDVVRTPELVCYSSFRSFLRDWLQAQDGATSLRGFAISVGASHSLVSQIVNGQRDLDDSRIDAFVRALGLTRAEAELFAALVDLEQTHSRARRRVARKAVARLGGAPAEE